MAKSAEALSDAHKEGKLEEFIEMSMQVFTTLGKVEDGFDFLASVEGRVNAQTSQAYRNGIENLVKTITGLPKQQIESALLSQPLT